MNIKNIIFDLGEVIIRVDTNNTIKAFETLGAPEIDRLYNATSQRQEFFNLYETGKIDCATFRTEVCKALNLQLADEQIDWAWNAMIGEIPKAHFELLERLQQTYKTFLFSNTNKIHLDFVNRYLAEAYGMDSLGSFFIKDYYSHLVGKRKPHPEVFQLILDEHGLQPEQTLFLDDLDEHLAGAACVGIKTQKVTREKGILELLKDF